MQEVEFIDEDRVDHAHPERTTRRINRPIAFVLLAITVAAIGVSLTTSDNGYPISAMNREQRATDAVPAFAVDGLDSSSSRKLARKGDATFWVALDAENQYCIVITISGAAPAAGRSCGDERSLGNGTLFVGVGVSAAGPPVTAALVADGGAPTSAGSWKKLSKNVFLDRRG